MLREGGKEEREGGIEGREREVVVEEEGEEGCGCEGGMR